MRAITQFLGCFWYGKEIRCAGWNNSRAEGHENYLHDTPTGTECTAATDKITLKQPKRILELRLQLQTCVQIGSVIMNVNIPPSEAASVQLNS